MNALGLRSICQLVCLQVLYRKPSNHSYLQKRSKDVIAFCAYLRKYHSPCEIPLENGIPWKSMEIYEIPWKSMEIHGQYMVKFRAPYVQTVSQWF